MRAREYRSLFVFGVGVKLEIGGGETTHYDVKLRVALNLDT